MKQANAQQATDSTNGKSSQGKQFPVWTTWFGHFFGFIFGSLYAGVRTLAAGVAAGIWTVVEAGRYGLRLGSTLVAGITDVLRMVAGGR
jgi:hypothetical protein